MNHTKITIGIAAFNEEANIHDLLENIFSQQLKDFIIDEVIVVSSGSTDNTNKIVTNLANKNSKVKLITEASRSGKSAAVNLIIQASKNNIIVLESADTIPYPETIQNLCEPLLKEDIGLSGAHPIPNNNPHKFVGYCIHTLWELHHQIALKSTKCGEMIAFKKVFDSIPAESPVDEASIEHEILKKGLKKIYVADAKVKNHGPNTISEFIKQRTRINAGHYWLKQKYHHKVSTNSPALLLEAIWKELLQKPTKAFWLTALISLEAYSKILAFINFHILRKNYRIWEQLKSTKKL